MTSLSYIHFVLLQMYDVVTFLVIYIYCALLQMYDDVTYLVIYCASLNMFMTSLI